MSALEFNLRQFKCRGSNFSVPVLNWIAHFFRLPTHEQADVVVARTLIKLGQELDVVGDAVTWKRKICNLDALNDLRFF
jgi:hypothetical protein